jgi:hypothetical protein
MPDGVPVVVDNGHAKLAAGVPRRCLREPAGDPGVENTEAARLSGPQREAGGRREGDVEVPQGQVDL